MSSNCNDIYSNNLVIEKSADTNNAVVGDVIEYSVTVINQGDMLINNVTIIDTLDSSLEFVQGSVVVGNIPLPNANVLEGVDAGGLNANEIKILTFKAKIISRPKSGNVSNAAIAKFYYDPHLTTHLEVMDKKSNIVTIQVDLADVDICKTSDIDMASRGDIITYTVTVTNIGTLEAKNILFIDNLPKEVNLVPNSLTVNGDVINYSDNNISLYIGSILPGKSIIVTYKVKVISSNCTGIITNQAFVKFNYSLYNCSFGEKTTPCDAGNISEVKLGISTFKQISIDQNLCIPSVKPDIEEINDMKVEAEILECHVINTPVITSNEGQTLSGYKLIFRGVLKEIIEYTSATIEQSVHSAHYQIPFSSFIILPSTFTLGSKIDIQGIVEDIYYKQIDERCFFKNITLLINAKIMSC